VTMCQTWKFCNPQPPCAVSHGGLARSVTLPAMGTPATVFDTRRQLLRHSVATLACPGGNAVRDAPAGFAEFRASETTRIPGQILAHIGDLLDWVLSLAQG
jgi:hypothetical protein